MLGSFLGLFSCFLGGNGEGVGTLGVVRPRKEGGGMGGNEDEDGEHKGEGLGGDQLNLDQRAEVSGGRCVSRGCDGQFVFRHGDGPAIKGGPQGGHDGRWAGMTKAAKDASDAVGFHITKDCQTQDGC